MSEAEVSGTFEIINRLGLHARAASRLVQVASQFPCQVTVRRDEQVANAKSVMGVLLLCGAKGARVTVVADGENAQEAVLAIGQLISDKFGEQD
ncbi:MAG TPA: HPr family phosphocarrier protein [Polyangiaceae bacterium]|nr:HPr family phosphocarrier protein [Polyangiaceae bacterium]